MKNKYHNKVVTIDGETKGEVVSFYEWAVKMAEVSDNG